MAGGTLGVFTGSSRDADGPADVRRRLARMSLTFLVGFAKPQLCET